LTFGLSIDILQQLLTYISDISRYFGSLLSV
jgi:hypothetical protein